MFCFFFFFFNDTATTEIYTLSLHDALPISASRAHPRRDRVRPLPPPWALARCGRTVDDALRDGARSCVRGNDARGPRHARAAPGGGCARLPQLRHHDAPSGGTARRAGIRERARGRRIAFTPAYGPGGHAAP